MAFGGASSFSAAFMRGGHGGHNVFTRQLLIWVVTALLLGVCGWSSGLLVTYALDVTMMTASPSPPGGGSAAARSPAQKQSKKGKKGNAGSGKAKPAPAAQKPQAVPRPLMHTPVVTEQAGVHDDEEAIPASTQEPDTPAVVQTRPTAVIGESDARKEHAEMEMLAKEHGSEDDTKVVERTAEEKVGLMSKSLGRACAFARPARVFLPKLESLRTSLRTGSLRYLDRKARADPGRPHPSSSRIHL